MDLKTFGRTFLGRPAGYKPSAEEFEADKKAYEYYVKKSIDNRFDPEILNTQQGMYARYDGTNAIAIAPVTTNAQGQAVRGDALRGYAADPYATEAGAPTPMAGGGAFAGTNAPTAAPTPQPAPTPSYTMTQAQASQRFGTNMPVGTHRVPKLGGVLVITP
jgi:hypothetical protein